jgi:hypothetical protein
MEVSAEELGRRAAEMRSKRIAKETCEYVAKELFRDIRRNFEKLSLATARVVNVSPKDKKHAPGEQGSVLPTGEPVDGWGDQKDKRSSSSKAARKAASKASSEQSPLDDILPNAGDDDGAWNLGAKSPPQSEIIPLGASAEPLIHKRALMDALKEKDNPWYPRANAVKGMRPMMGIKAFEIAFLLHPVSRYTYMTTLFFCYYPQLCLVM